MTLTESSEREKAINKSRPSLNGIDFTCTCRLLGEQMTSHVLFVCSLVGQQTKAKASVHNPRKPVGFSISFLKRKPDIQILGP